ncbi:MAG: nucleotide pyrophosphohydrolase [Candidatus Asgardarchaeum sp.]|nr:nucleotide pyrophosphohydrolase [Candidatus Odinarchaeota archaeon]
MSRELTLHEAQKIVDDWINQFEEGYWPPLAQLADLVEEIGELARIINTLENIKKPKPGEKINELEMEMGDVLFSLICLANYYKVDLAKALLKVIKKYDTRDFNRWTPKKHKEKS